jgi:hypothetical protein
LNLSSDLLISSICSFKWVNLCHYNMPLYDRDGYNSVVVQGRLQEKVFPKILSENYPEAFCFQECNFKVQRSKESTARVVVWRELGLANSFTLEASFAGPSEGAHEVGLCTLNQVDP